METRLKRAANTGEGGTDSVEVYSYLAGDELPIIAVSSHRAKRLWTEMGAGFTLNLRLHSGVPIVDVLGSWDQALTDALTDTVGALASAGHFEIVLNVQRAALEGISGLRSLARAGESIRAHYGHLDVVCTTEQIDRLARDCRDFIAGPFRLASTEEGAIGRIKRIPVLAAGVLCTARPLRREPAQN